MGFSCSPDPTLTLPLSRGGKSWCFHVDGHQLCAMDATEQLKPIKYRAWTARHDTEYEIFNTLRRITSRKESNPTPALTIVKGG